MSDTPRTDAQLLTVKDCSYVAPHPTGEYVHADFARQLEHENAALRAEIEEAQCVVIGTRLEARELRRENDELLERLGRAAVDEGKLRRENTRLLEAVLNARKEAQL